MPSAADVVTMQVEFTQLCTLITQVLASPQPSYSENGRSVSMSEYLNTLYDRRTKLMEDIAKASGPFTLLD